MTDEDDYGEPSDDSTADLRPGELPDVAKRALAMLLQRRFVTRAKNRGVWDAIMEYREELSAQLANLFLDLEVDEFRGVVFKRQSRGDGALKVLREETIGREASFLLVHLRKEYALREGSDEAVVVQRSEIEEFLRPFLADAAAANGKRFAGQVESAITSVESIGLLSRRTDIDYLYDVSPAIVSLIGLDELQAFSALYRQYAASAKDDEDVA